jgi:hypothetical protein
LGEGHSATLVRKTLGLQSRYTGLVDRYGGNSIWRLLENRNLDGSVNSSCHPYFSLTDGYFSHSQRLLRMAIVVVLDRNLYSARSVRHVRKVRNIKRGVSRHTGTKYSFSKAMEEKF